MKYLLNCYRSNRVSAELIRRNAKVCLRPRERNYARMIYDIISFVTNTENFREGREITSRLIKLRELVTLFASPIRMKKKIKDSLVTI